MADPDRVLEELLAQQREVAALRAERQASPADEAGGGDAPEAVASASDIEANSAAGADPDFGETVEATLEAIAADFDVALKAIEDATRKRPAAALAIAFAAGLLVGRLASRP